MVHHTETDSADVTVSSYHQTGDDHPSPAGDAKATAEFVPCLENFAQAWVDWRAGSEPPAQTEAFSLSTQAVDFGTSCAGSAPAQARSITVTNTGSATLALSLGTAENYVASAASASQLAAGATASFTLRPASGLTAGSYSTALTVTAGSLSKDIALNYIVREHSYSFAWTYDNDNHWHVCAYCGGTSGVAAHSFTQSGTAYSCSCGYSYTVTPPAAQATYYVSPTGRNSTGDGSSASPWQTLEYASTRVTSAGDAIYLNAGTYTLSAQVNIAPGVSLTGAGRSATTLVSSLSDGTWGERAAVNLVSSVNTDGNQTVSGIKFDGNSLAGDAALRIQNRNNVEVFNCEFVDFNYFAVGWNASDANETPPSVYVEHGSFHDNITTNCAGATDWQRGALLCGGIYDFDIYNNTMIENQRAAGKQGWPIKFWYYSGWMVDCKIYNNYLEKTDNTAWSFAIESINQAGMEIFDNTIIGSVDVNSTYNSMTVNGTTYTYDYGVYVHDNVIGAKSKDVDILPLGVVLEMVTESALRLRCMTTALRF